MISDDTTSDPPMIQIPSSCDVLVVGGGPGGAYAAAAAALEGLQVVLLEAEKFPRYHIGESMLPAMRHLLRFIDADSAFNNFGFTKKIGAAFKLSPLNREGYTDFLAAGGPENYSWNVVRADADMILLEHAAKCGAKVFDGVKVTTVRFKDDGDPSIASPVEASYKDIANVLEGQISFRYLVDASGRAGLLSQKYLKNRIYNDDLRNVATWAYWSDVDVTARGTDRENTPFFEALTDGSGWAWFIPLHTSTSIGVVTNQKIAIQKKRSTSRALTSNKFYLEQLRLAPTLFALIGDGKQLLGSDGEPELKSASDYSYMSSYYALPGFRIVGDAGAFIDPLFSSGVHLALTSGLSAAITICAAVRGDCTEAEAADWHSDKVRGSFSWFLMVVLGTYEQIRAQEEPILSEADEDNFDRAFELFRPVIQGCVDVHQTLSEENIAEAHDFCETSWDTAQPNLRESLLRKIRHGLPDRYDRTSNTSSYTSEYGDSRELENRMTAEEQRLLAFLKSRRLLRTEDTMNMRNFSADVVRGYRPRLVRGKLGLDNVLGHSSL